jgi:hypothetical protein
MSYRMTYEVNFQFCPDGVGQVMEGTSAASMTFIQAVPFNPVVPGGNSPTQANFITALQNMVTDITNQLTGSAPQNFPNSGYTTNLARLQAFATNPSA